MKKVLVTGASGFVGRHLIETLLQRDISIVAIYFSNPPNFFLGNERVSWVRLDLRHESIENFLKDIDVVFHLAGFSGQGNDHETLNSLKEVNVEITKKIARNLTKSGIRLIYVSSIHAGDGMWSSKKSEIVNEQNGRALTEYGKSKRIAEECLHQMKSFGLDYVILRPTQLFGEYHKGSIYELARAISNQRFVMIGDGKNATNFYYIKDFIAVLVLVAEKAQITGQTYIVAAKSITLIDLVACISLNLQIRPPKFRLPLSIGILMGVASDYCAKIFSYSIPISRQRVFAMTKDVAYSTKKFNNEIGPTSIHGTINGISQTMQWYKSVGLI